ncbi:DUF4160 domain-containing protein [Tepidimonas taiwanensis]|uniref:Transcriptional regulator n=1 Tax=Tepidimonas taiwanensis TaxID=307486 RepID=A0A554X570_9BURK|nr:DUF4160 domain-containing protein [Tepidimonas taiwanensis]MCX7692530.1 DUF4160 domain-containing protein [Tepidimonas taiwanensis]MDM7463322.1 DUF4160 domain-containing protein [Tepidimonas taiwanensis]TSE30973.1 hypothetical protein Ttaiw_01722 [Tepidimonas taiwanensis]UBQ05818.1 DUF4160 domain-containing protein [Tepidimonas taiwanensis]
MPTISAFYGILIRMYWDDHAPPHFHVTYGEYRAVYAIETLALLQGALPRRAHAMVLEWAAQHRAALMEDWELCANKQQPKPISPLV